MNENGYEFRLVRLSPKPWCTSRTVMASVRNGWALHDCMDMVAGSIVAGTIHVTHVATGIAVARGKLTEMHALWRDLARTVPNAPMRRGATDREGHPLWVEFIRKVHNNERFPGRCPRVPFWLPVGD